MTTKEEPVAPIATPTAELSDSSDHLAPPPEPAPPSAVPAEQAATELTLPSRRALARWLLVALAIYAVGWLLINALPSLTPFIIGLVLAYLLLPIVNRLGRRMPR